MESICIMRQLYKALAQYEEEFEKTFDMSLNEAMALCSLSQESTALTASEIAEKTSMKPSHTSKVIRSIESKELIERSLGHSDKRQMYFTLTPNGTQRLEAILAKEIEIPEILRPIFEMRENSKL